MENSKWIERWEEGNTGWHLNEPNPTLLKFLDHSPLLPESKILIPLCGATHDLHFLADLGHKVIGVDLSQKALSLIENHQNITLICGDIFEIDLPDKFDFIFDRACSVALQRPLRKAFSSLYEELLDNNGKIFLMALEYDQKLRNGPPYSYTETEVRENYKSFNVKNSIASIESTDKFDIEINLKNYLITKK